MSISLALTPSAFISAWALPQRERAGGKAGQRVAEHVGPGQTQAVHRAGGDDQGVGAVQAAGDADHDLLDPGGQQARLKAADLDVVDLLAALVAAGGIGRHVGEALDAPAQRRRLARGSAAARTRSAAIVRSRSRRSWIRSP